MPTKANGPLLEDYTRALKAAKKAGAKAVRVEIGGSAITILLDDAPTAAQPAALSAERWEDLTEAERETIRRKSERGEALTQAERRTIHLKL